MNARKEDPKGLIHQRGYHRLSIGVSHLGRDTPRKAIKTCVSKKIRPGFMKKKVLRRQTNKFLKRKLKVS